MVKRKIRIVCSPTLAITTMSIACILFGLYIFTVAYEPCRTGLAQHITIFVIWTSVASSSPFIVILAYSRKLYSIITIDETGISRSFLGRFHKLHIPWDSMAEVVYFIAIAEFLTFSKTKKVSQMTYNKMRMEKDAIELTLSKRRYAVIAQYLQQPIVGMPDKVKERLTKEKQKKK